MKRGSRLAAVAMLLLLTTCAQQLHGTYYSLDNKSNAGIKTRIVFKSGHKANISWAVAGTINTMEYEYEVGDREVTFKMGGTTAVARMVEIQGLDCLDFGKSNVYGTLCKSNK
jgi:hypothetical protein